MKILVCPSCDKEFETKHGMQKYCHDCKNTVNRNNTSRTKKRINHDIQFIGIDGEGLTRNNTHDYVLLSVGNKSLYNKDYSRLRTEQVFEFLYNCYEDDVVFGGYFLLYDFSQWLRDLPENKARELLDDTYYAYKNRIKKKHKSLPFPVRWKQWEFDILPNMKRFRIRKRRQEKWMWICDFGPFFQTSFLKAIDPKNWKIPILDNDEYKILEYGKESLRKLDEWDNKLIEYNTKENEILSRLMKELNKGLLSLDLKLKKSAWFGPGQAMQTWMNNNCIPTKDEIVDSVPEDFLLAARGSFYGGWFEVFAHGIIPSESYEYDINSSYPSTMATLPCLLHGNYTDGTSKERPPELKSNSIRLLYAEVKGEDEVCGAMLHRNPKYTILRPKKTIGWFWAHEINAAFEAGVVSSIKVMNWKQYDPCNCISPFYKFENMYNERLRVGKDSSTGKAYKLLYNSGYGKTAQSQGEPRFSNPIYASLITSKCRTQILSAIATHPTRTKDLLMVATDGVFFKTRHPYLKLSEKLGEWSEEIKENLTIHMPGVYWDDETRKRIELSETPKMKSRGISARILSKAIKDIDKMWEEWRNKDHKKHPFKDIYCTTIDYELPKITIPVDFNMITPKQAIKRNSWSSCGKVETDTERVLSADFKAKRHMITQFKPYVRSSPWPVIDPIESLPYDKSFGYDLEEKFTRDSITTLSGDFDLIAREVFDGF